MPHFNRTKMCKTCPFKKGSMKGWLGPHTIEDIEIMLSIETDFPCHEEVDKLPEEQVPSLEKASKHVNHCVGYLRYMNKTLKLSREADKAQAQDRLKSIPDEEVIDAFKFREYHTTKEAINGQAQYNEETI